jgi:DNA-binding NtrC family response regulator
LIATTNRDLTEMVRAGQFREDLFYRLNVIPLKVPALRTRPRDVDLLARFFVDVSAHLNGKVPKRLSEEAIQKLLTWNWPGNVRELENVIERAVLTSKGVEITNEEISISGFELHQPPAGSAQSTAEFSPGMTISEAEKRLIMKTLEYTNQNRTRAAHMLGISIRTLRNKLHEYGAMGGPQEILVDGTEERM